MSRVQIRVVSALRDLVRFSSRCTDTPVLALNVVWPLLPGGHCALSTIIYASVTEQDAARCLPPESPDAHLLVARVYRGPFGSRCHARWATSPCRDAGAYVALLRSRRQVPA